LNAPVTVQAQYQCIHPFSGWLRHRLRKTPPPCR
jgi:hypothetical protein